MARASKSERRAQIVAGLKQVMARNGYAGASMRAIADAAGLTTGLLHYHFPNKQAILLGLIAHLEESLSARLDREAMGEAALRDTIDALLAVESADPAALACWTQVNAEAQRDPIVGAAWCGVIDRQVERITNEFNILQKGRAEAVALWAAVEGYVQLAAVHPEAVPPGTAAVMARAMLDGLLR